MAAAETRFQQLTEREVAYYAARFLAVDHRQNPGSCNFLDSESTLTGGTMNDRVEALCGTQCREYIRGGYVRGCRIHILDTLEPS